MKDAEVLAILHTPGNDIINQTTGTFDKENNIITYYETDDDKTFVKFDFNNLTLYRENENIEMTYHFKEQETTKNNVTVKGIEQTLYVSITTTKILRDDRYIYIKYQVIDANEECAYEIKYEEI
ncbi:MAG: hypothetical protein HFG48_00320 [Bacilli bacterium]|nr:hypothetical protein [Bacilli bacterium]